LNNLLVVEEHPLLVVENIIARHGAGLTFTYSYYEVAQPGFQAMAPRSAVLRVRARDLTPEWVDDRFRELKANEELAWHSWVECQGTGYHIPMIDLVNSPSRSILRDLSRRLVSEMSLSGDFVYFETGQSFHGYFSDLVSERAWLNYLGQLLLLNKEDWPQTIDTRWVGHALARGFSALRWSNNTTRYRAMPRLSRVFDPTGV
jgi:hypothetical protein